MLILNINSLDNGLEQELSKIVKFVKSGQIIDKDDVIVSLYYPDFNGMKEIDFLILDAEKVNSLYKNNDFDIDYFLMDLSVNKSSLIMKNRDKLDSEIKEILEEYDIEVKENAFSFDREINLSNVDDIDMSIILEIFQEQTILSQYYIYGQTLIILDVEGSNVTINGSKTIKLNELVENFNYMFEDNKIIKLESDNNNNLISGLSFSFFTKSIFADFDSVQKMYYDIINYKYRVFHKIKDLKSKDYLNLDRKITDLLDKHNYIPISKIHEIINSFD